MLTHNQSNNQSNQKPLMAQVKSDRHLIEMWLQEKSSFQSRRAYTRDIHYFLAFVEGKAIAKVNYNDLQDYHLAIEEQGYSRATINRRMAAIKSLLSFGQRLGYLQFNVGSIVKLKTPKNTLPERILTEMEVMTMLALEQNQRNKLIIHFLYSSGGRISEICELKWKDLKAVGDRGQVTFYGKGDKTRVIPLSSAIWQELLKLRGDSGDNEPIFTSRKKNTSKKGALQPNQIRRIVTAAAKRAGIKGRVSPHWFRHSHASHALDRGASLQLVRDSLGHSSIAITERYLHARPNDGSSLYLPF